MTTCTYPDTLQPRVITDPWQQQVAAVAEAVHERIDPLARSIASAIIREVRLYQPTSAVKFDTVVSDCAANLRAVLVAMAAGTEFDTSVPAEVGVRRARGGMPLSSVMEAYRVGFRRLWDAMGSEATTRADPSVKALHTLTADVLNAEGLFISAMAVGYREEQARRLLADEAQRSVLIEALLYGRLFEQWNLWEVADCLRLPSTGPFVVVAAEVPVVGGEALPGIASKMRAVEVFSAWRLLADLQVGIVHVRTDTQFDNVVALLSRMATTRVGVSARYDDLRQTAEALRNARMMLRARSDAGPRVAVFDGSIVATAVVSAPEQMVKLVAPVLDQFADLSAEERDVLFWTFRAWLDTDGSPTAAAELLCCHPNTVRYRLRRIEERTGRSLSRPRHVAELCLIFEVQRSLVRQEKC
ncbi:MAG TPA: helix-turn-helix domain-containing protein [Mycobacterium sp.]|nr:helix-turn-helix domain-containing protein [Mycobacterium sp.]